MSLQPTVNLVPGIVLKPMLSSIIMYNLVLNDQDIRSFIIRENNPFGSVITSYDWDMNYNNTFKHNVYTEEFIDG